MGVDRPKQFLMVQDKPIISYCFDIFQKHMQIDKMVVVVYCDAFGAACFNDLSQDRSAAEVQITVPAMWQGCEVYCYAFVLRDDAEDYQASMTYYLGSGTLS